MHPEGRFDGFWDGSTGITGFRSGCRDDLDVVIGEGSGCDARD